MIKPQNTEVLESSDCVLYTTASDVWGSRFHRNPHRAAPFKQFCANVWHQKSVGDDYRPHASALGNPTLGLTWSSASCFAVFKSFHYPIIPITVGRGIYSMDEILGTDLLQRWHPITVLLLGSLSSSGRPFFFFLQMLVNAWVGRPGEPP